MNICILTFDYPPHPVYGSGVYVDFLTRLLRQTGHKVEILTLNRFGLIQDNDAIFCKCTHEQKAVQCGKCVCSSKNMACLQGLLERAITKFSKVSFVPDVIYVNGYMFFNLAYRLHTIYKNAKLVSAIHFLVEQNDVSPDDPERQRIYMEESRMIIASDEIIYFGDLAYRLIEKRNICNMNKFNLIQHAVNVEVVKRKFQGNRGVVYVGRLEPGKGIELLCKSLSGVNEKFSFDIIGGGRLYRSINEKYGTKYHMHGYKDKEFVLEQLRNSDFFILPSFSEQCPVVVLEGMACGCIPILSDFGNLSNLIKQHSSGVVFDIALQEEVFVKNIADAISRALKLTNKLADTMIERNYQLLNQHFSPETMLKATLEVFRK